DDGAYCPVRLDVQLISQQGRVNLGLPQRTGAVAGGDQRSDETRGDARTVRVQPSQPAPPLDRPLTVAAPRGFRREPLEHAGREPGEPAAFGFRPALKLRGLMRVAEVDAIEKRPCIQGRG